MGANSRRVEHSDKPAKESGAALNLLAPKATDSAATESGAEPKERKQEQERRQAKRPVYSISRMTQMARVS